MEQLRCRLEEVQEEAHRSTLLPCKQGQPDPDDVGSLKGRSHATIDGPPLWTVESVQVTSGGSGYQSAPTVIFEDDNFEGDEAQRARAQAILNAAGEVVEVQVSNCTPNRSAWTKSCTVRSGHSQNVKVKFVGGGGSGASAVASLRENLLQTIFARFQRQLELYSPDFISDNQGFGNVSGLNCDQLADVFANLQVRMATHDIGCVFVCVINIARTGCRNMLPQMNNLRTISPVSEQLHRFSNHRMAFVHLLLGILVADLRYRWLIHHS